MADSNPQAFGAWVRSRREQLGLSLREFALASGLDPGNLSKYERELLPAPQEQDTLKRIATALKLKHGTREYEDFVDLAAASAGRIPPDLAADPRVLSKMPLLFRTARGKLSRAKLIELAERLKDA